MDKAPQCGLSNPFAFHMGSPLEKKSKQVGEESAGSVALGKVFVQLKKWFNLKLEKFFTQKISHEGAEILILK
jgi:hypothetical protein